MPSAKGDKADIKLQDGDTVFIPAGQRLWAGQRARYARLPCNEPGADDTIDSMLAVAGGLPVMADPKRATLSASTLSEPAALGGNFRAGRRLAERQWKAGDLLSIAPLLPEFANFGGAAR